MFTRSQKIIIYNLLLEKYSLNQTLTYQELVLYLRQNGLDCKEFEYESYDDLFKDLSEFLKENVVDGKKTYLLKNYEDKNVEQKRTIYVPRTNTFNDNTNHYQNTFKRKEESKNKITKLTNNPVRNGSRYVDEQTKKVVNDLLYKKFRENELYQLSVVTKYLKKYGINYKEYGYKKIKGFFQNFDNIKMVDKMTDNVPACYLSISYPDKEKKVEFPDFDEIYIPDKIYIYYIQQAENKTSEDKIKEFLEEKYYEAIKDQTYSFKDETLMIPAADFVYAVRKSSSKTDYDYFISFIGKKDNIKNSDIFTDIIHFDNIDKKIVDLAKLARKETWCFKNSKDKFLILKIYLQYTFLKLYNDNQISYSNDKNYLAFNTGLITDNFEEIYLLAGLNKSDNKYNFLNFTTSGIKGDGKILVENFNPLPVKAKYTDNIADLFFDAKQILITDYDHIILDNIDRLPLQFINLLANNLQIKKIIKQLIKTSNHLKKQLYDELSLAIKKDKDTLNTLKYFMEKAIDLAVKEVKNDYHYILAGYYPNRNVISLLLPLKLVDKNNVDCFLVVEKMQSNNYQGQTILPVKHAYTNARLLGPLKNTYLNPNDIFD